MRISDWSSDVCSSDLLYHTFAEQLAKLPDTTRIYPGHDYIANNLRFTLDREPDNGKAEALLREVDPQDTDRALITTLAQEKEVNAFFRLTSPPVLARLRQAFPDLPEIGRASCRERVCQYV